MNNKHEFAIYFKDLQDDKSQLILADKDLYHRVVNILRMKLNERFILFNNKQNFLVEIIFISKKDLTVKVLHKELNKILSPSIIVFLSILKRDSFEEAIYYCVELGVNVIQPIITEKVHFKKWENKERKRLQRIIISAAEQSKNFNLPEFREPQKLEHILSDLTKGSTKIFFDAQGQNLNEFRAKGYNAELNLLIGPEGDLTPLEKELLKNAQFNFCKLTPTILRAQTAVALSIGLFRTL